MFKTLLRLLPLLLLAGLLSGCWSSKEIEKLAVYSGLALDVGVPAPVEKDFEEQGANFTANHKVMATVQIVPVKSASAQQDNKQKATQHAYQNVSGSGDSIFEIFRQFSIRLDRPIIGHHLKVIVISSELLRRQTMEQLMDFVLRDNDIRPSTMVFVSQGEARETMASAQPNEVPSLHIKDMLHNRSRTSKVLEPVTLSKIDALTYAKRSFVLQSIVAGGGESEFSGAGIIKGSSGHWIGHLNQEDTECLAWLTQSGTSGVIKAYDEKNEPLSYEIESVKSKIKTVADKDRILFKVSLSFQGRISETWSDHNASTSNAHAEKLASIVEDRLASMMQTLLHKLQSEFKADVAGFGRRLSIQHPSVWKKVKNEWDDVFSRSHVEIKYDVKVTNFGSIVSTE
ncbi:Ger(x)C family spore germination protein [Cohnella hashimotonis]|uniref:Ger(X)C family spore germination protein n=1 Tax=Cohnella hashimotonis TaxID=2826895 RepID=A0ABT6TGD5_9BACL|nr:Ger(x)C family spore germination protein [Cohnella hashimotonis]MDI4645904.1 Ger(x)C family spore germination protein [Cohnella hashimotonis]